MVDESKPTAAQLAGTSSSARPSTRGPLHRRGAAQEEDATKLQFGDFGDGEALTIGEVQHLLQISRDGPNIPPPPDNKVYKSTVDYVNEFANADSNVTGSMRAALTARPGFLNQFEVAQIMYLRPPSVDVAVALIPSLERYNQEDEHTEILQQLLDDVRGFARYGGVV
ncbi:DNA-directed RNA polymerase II subunit RPB4 [Vanrija pseudolonga]|uniref:DNA-directed RNA polymerase II subunit RPB4 n=1 Tax=Vanrija pseudolonga TaxID=143232 RepID=A0AAF0YCI1_9TREE|nr:DNA-directed RNA polymerase II subunit RPB4 [Vanrija pseudolonga]